MRPIGVESITHVADYLTHGRVIAEDAFEHCPGYVMVAELDLIGQSGGHVFTMAADYK